MAIKARDQVTIAVGVDVASVDIYYKLQLSTATPPIKPSTANPSGWSTTEPTYDSVSTNTLYTCQKTTLTDGTFYWSSVSKSTSYEAAKTAWNLANSASTAIDNLQVGGRNLLVNTGNYNTWDASSTTAPVTKADGYIKFTPPASAQWITIEPHSAYIPIADWDTSGTYTVSVDVKFDNFKVADARHPAVALSAVTSNTRIGFAARVYERSFRISPTTNDWTHFEYTVSGDYTTWTNVTSGTPAYIKVYIWLYLNSSNADAVSFRRLKLEKGNKATDWTPAPEDLASASDSIEYVEGTQTGATGAWTGSTKDSALYAGKSIAYKLPYAGSGNATLSLVLGSVDIPSAWTDDATGSDVTGVNLLKNSATMSVGTSSWANGVWRTAGGTTGMTRSRVQITDGPNGSCYGVQGVGIQTLTTDATCWGIDSMPRTANGVYTFSFYARVVGGGVAQAGWNIGNAIKTIDTNATETYGTAPYWLKTLDSSGAWTRVWATVCATTTAANIYIGVIATDTTSKTVQICNVKIEKLPAAIAPVYLGTTRMTTHFGAGSIIQMTYDGANWRATSIPNTNNIDRRLHNNSVYAVSNITGSRLICGTEAGYRDVASSAAFDLSYPILYASAAIEATKTATSTYEALPTVNFSMTGTIESGAAYKQLYLKGTVSGNIFTVAASPFLTTVQPTTANGYFYIPIGVMASATNGYFATSKDLYAYTDGAFRQVNPATIVATQKIYYRSNAESSGTGVKPNGNGLPTTWVTNTSNTFNTTATNASGWSTKVSPLTNDGVTGSTKYLYLWTCEQRKRLDGTVAYTDIVLDENTTVIDGGRIITNSITANKLNASNINASKTLTVGALTDAAAETILNSNVVVGGRNLLLWTKNLPKGTDTSANGKDGIVTWGSALSLLTETVNGIKLTAAGNTQECIGIPLANNGSVNNNEDVILSFEARGNITSVGQFYWIQASGSNPSSTNWLNGSSSITLSETNWTKFTTNVKNAQANVRTCTKILIFYNLGSTNSGKWIEIRKGTLKLERGNKATDWSPAPEDVDANISKAAQTATNFLTTVDSTGLLVHRANNTNSGVKITDDVDIIRNGESVANYGEETRIGPEDERHVLITSDEFEFKHGNNIRAMLVAPTGGVEDVMLQLNVGPKDANGYATDYILRHGGQYSSSDGVGSSYIQASYSSGNISNLAGVFALASPNISQVQFIGNEITAVSNGRIYNASLDNLGFLLSARILLAGGDITLPANSGASATFPWQGPVIAGSSGQTAASFPNTNYIVVIGKSGNGQINGFDKVDFMVTGKTESQVTIAGWNSYSQAVTIHVVCIGFNSRYGSRA